MGQSPGLPGALALAVREAFGVDHLPASPAKVAVPERLQILTAKSSFWATALSMERDRLRNMQQLFGYPVVLITATTGLTIFASLERSPAIWAKITVGFFSIVAALLAAIQTHQDFTARATAAQHSGKCFAKLYADMLDLQDRADEKEMSAKAPALYDRYAELKETRPAVPDRVCDRASHRVEQDASIRKVLAEARATDIRAGAPRH